MHLFEVLIDELSVTEAMKDKHKHTQIENEICVSLKKEKKHSG